jgi:glycosyltransferase involved in cell wall biosynthesis
MTAHATPKVSVIIAVYQRDDFLEKVFVSLLNQTLRDFEIVVADDGSGRAIADVISRHADRFAHPIRHVWQEDEGFRKTVIVNKAVASTSSNYLVFVDGDCILHHRFLERHHRRARRGEVLSGRRVMFDEDLTQRVSIDDVRERRVERIAYWWKHAGKIDRWNGLFLPFLHGVRNAGRKNYQILGSNFSVHKTDFLAVNGYDERIVGRGLEDNNLWVRFRNSGVPVRTITREAIQYHLFHQAQPIPHSAEFVEAFRSSAETRTPHGIDKE